MLSATVTRTQGSVGPKVAPPDSDDQFPGNVKKDRIQRIGSGRLDNKPPEHMSEKEVQQKHEEDHNLSQNSTTIPYYHYVTAMNYFMEVDDLKSTDIQEAVKYTKVLIQKQEIFARRILNTISQLPYRRSLTISEETNDLPVHSIMDTLPQIAAEVINRLPSEC